MRIAAGSDEATPLTAAALAALRERGHQVDPLGPLAGAPMDWAAVAEAVARRVAAGACDQGLLFCWTGTGVSIAANKVPGVRAALCGDAETAAGARRWNDANVLCLSLQRTPVETLPGILDAWFSAAVDPAEGPAIDRVRRLDGSLPPA